MLSCYLNFILWLDFDLNVGFWSFHQSHNPSGSNWVFEKESSSNPSAGRKMDGGWRDGGDKPRSPRDRTLKSVSSRGLVWKERKCRIPQREEGREGVTKKTKHILTYNIKSWHFTFYTAHRWFKMVIFLWYFILGEAGACYWSFSVSRSRSWNRSNSLVPERWKRRRRR